MESYFASLLRSNHDIIFDKLSNNARVFIYYIINYIKKGDCSQYQLIMRAGFIGKVYEAVQLPKKDDSLVAPNKFTHKAFNHLIYNREISGFLVASELLRLPT